MSAIKAGGAYVEFFIRDHVTKHLARLGRRMKTAGAGLTQVGMRLAAGSAAIASPFAFAIKSASDLQETMNKFNVVFGSAADDVKQWGDDTAQQFGRSKKQVADFLAGAQDLLIPMGFDKDDATDTSKTLTKLAMDLASFNNMADEDVMSNLQAALTGSGMVMKKYGVILTEAAVKQELLNQGLNPEAATNAQKAQARLNIILAGTTAAQGDAIRSGGSFANQMKALKASVADTAAELGAHLLPLVTPLVAKAAQIATTIGKWIAANKALFTTLAKILAAVFAVGVSLVAAGTLLGVLGGAFSAIATVIGTVFGAAITIVTTLLTVLASPIGILIAALAGLTAAWFTMTDSGASALTALTGTFGKIKTEALTSWKGIVDAFMAGDLQLAAKIAWLGLQLIWKENTAGLANLWLGFKETMIGAFDGAITYIRVHWAEMAGWLGQKIARVIAYFTGIDPDAAAADVARQTKLQNDQLNAGLKRREDQRRKESQRQFEAGKQELRDLRAQRDEAVALAATKHDELTKEIAKQPDTKKPPKHQDQAPAIAAVLNAPAALAKGSMAAARAAFANTQNSQYAQLQRETKRTADAAERTANAVEAAPIVLAPV